MQLNDFKHGFIQTIIVNSFEDKVLIDMRGRLCFGSRDERN